MLHAQRMKRGCLANRLTLRSTPETTSRRKRWDDGASRWLFFFGIDVCSEGVAVPERKQCGKSHCCEERSIKLWNLNSIAHRIWNPRRLIVAVFGNDVLVRIRRGLQSLMCCFLKKKHRTVEISTTTNQPSICFKGKKLLSRCLQQFPLVVLAHSEQQMDRIYCSVFKKRYKKILTCSQ